MKDSIQELDAREIETVNGAAGEQLGIWDHFPNFRIPWWNVNGPSND